jgi:iron-sulfur cluster assembly accessory protein
MIEQQPIVTEPTPPGTVVSLSDAAVAKLSELTKEETNPDIGLRVYVYSGGCSGFRYGMMLEDAPTPEDNVLDVSGIKVYVDGQSISLLQGSQIDYVDTLMGAGFTVNNPNAVAACGCGSSFRTADDAGTARSCAHRRLLRFCDRPSHRAGVRSGHGHGSTRSGHSRTTDAR